MSPFADFLDSGMKRITSPSLQAACARTALTLSVNVEPDVPVIIVSWPLSEKERAS